MGWRRFFLRASWDEERRRELESYLDIETDDNIARGMTPEQARHAARRKLGNATLIREDIYRMNTVPVLDALWQDLKYGARLLRRNPGFALVAILSLALGIGANTAIFHLLDALRLRTLPVKAPQELFDVRITNAPNGRTGNFIGPIPQLTNPLWEQIRERQTAFAGVFAWGGHSFNLARGGEARFVDGLWVSGQFFQVLGVEPALGRLLGVADDLRGCASPVAVLSYGFWQRAYGRSSSILGRTIDLDGQAFTIVGVTPAPFFGVQVGRTFDVAVPICSERLVNAQASVLDGKAEWWLSVMGRLKAGWSPAQAAANLKSISPGIFQATLPEGYTASDARDYVRFQLTPVAAATGLSRLRDTYVSPLWLLLSIAGLVLLIACANLANLMIARASARQQEIAIRLAVGASRARLVRQLLAESLLLSALGAALAVLLAQGLGRSLVAFLSTPDRPLFLDLSTDWRVLGFTAVVAVSACALFGLAPAVRATRAAPGGITNAGGGRSSESRERVGLRRVLVVAQVAISVVLVANAGLFVRTFRSLSTVDAGFRQDGLAVVDLDFTRLKVPAGRQQAFRRQLLDRVGSAPFVESAVRASTVPMTGNFWNEQIRTEPGRPAKGLSNASAVDPGYFRTMGTPLLAGRDFDDRDTMTSPKVAIVTESFARRFFGASAAALGRTFQFEGAPGHPEPVYQIVGLARDTKYIELREQFGPIAFVAASQNQAADTDTAMHLVVRSRAPASDLFASISRASAAIDPGVDLRFRVLRTVVQNSLVRERLMATLSGFFGALAALLAAIGLYGLTSYVAARRRHELGIRMALGAQHSDVIRLVMRDSAGLLGIGLLAGIVLAIVAGRAASALLFGITPWDPLTIALTLAVLAPVGSLASFVPARRASRRDPIHALRQE